MTYRSEIDGLRALAVLPVILFHAGFEPFRGGYVGVDVFFVISGYLITSIILADLETGRFSLTRFYERRARRILPALFFVLLCCLPFAWFWLPPYYLQKFSQSLVAVTGFASNILFYLRSGYFSTEAELTPLLHTWSLAVEEQYYVVFPLLLLALWKFNKRWIPATLCLLALVSLGLSQGLVKAYPAAVFYLLPTRFWELALGALIAILLLKGRKPYEMPAGNRYACEVAGLLGIVLIGYAIARFDQATPFPSFYALIPTLGTALVILFSTPQTLSGRLLGNPVLVGIGLISYSAYLWHQPLLVFARQRSLTELTTTTTLALSALSLILAYLTWRFIEMPFRNREKLHRNTIFGLALTVSLLVMAIGLTGHLRQGFYQRELTTNLPSDYLESALEPPIHFGLDGTPCVSDYANMCQFSKTDSVENYLLVGDSHSKDYSLPFKTYVEEKSVNGWQMSVGGCGMIQGIESRSSSCREAVSLLKETTRDKKFNRIYLVAALLGHTHDLPPEQVLKEADSFVRLVETLSRSAEEIIVFYPRYSLNTETPIKVAVFGDLGQIRVRQEGENERIWLAAMQKLRALPKVSTFNEKDALIEAGCGDVGCFNGHDAQNYALYLDSNHLTKYGADLMWKRLDPDLLQGAVPVTQHK